MPTSPDKELHHSRILITGKSGGTGSSTTAKELSSLLHVPIIAGGSTYLRPLAREYELFKAAHAELLPIQQYLLFSELYTKTLGSEGLTGVSVLMRNGKANPAGDNVLEEFITAIKDHNEWAHTIDPVWDYIVDQSTTQAAMKEEGGFIWEAKLSILAFYIDQLRPLIDYKKLFAYPYLSVLLSVDPETAAQRISEREGRIVSTDYILYLLHENWVRYANEYTIQEHPIAHNDLNGVADIAIDTGHYGKLAVVEKILNKYEEKSRLYPTAVNHRILKEIKQAKNTLAVKKQEELDARRQSEEEGDETEKFPA